MPLDRRLPTKTLFAMLAAGWLAIFAQHAVAADMLQEQLLQRINANSAPLVLDVRKPDEYAAGHVPGAINVPHTELEGRLSELGPDKTEEMVVYCESGRRAAIAADILQQAGFTNIHHLTGDMKAWRQQGLPQETGDARGSP